MDKEYKHNTIGKVKGMYFNYSGKKNDEYMNTSVKSLRKLNNITIGLLQQSIHHVNFISDENGIIEKMTIGFRPMGIKPEDIDGIELEKKKEKEGLNNYEQLLYGIWKYHYNQGRNIESKIVYTIAKELHILKSIWKEELLIHYEKMPDEYKEEMEKQARNIMLKLNKYENEIKTK